ncbi:MAG: exported protein of unknown function [Alphaproteobacteria bacterium]|nr:exported protein of unknown function [Alphaproteobacteria bacterium]
MPKRFGSWLLAPLAAALLLPAGAPAAPGHAAPVPRHDLADAAQGSYFGDVISDARGSSHSDVRIDVAKIGPNKVRVTSDYARLPAFTATLTRAMDTIQNAGGAEVFLYDPTRTPPTLMISDADASWSGTKQN